jgi:hypothetical protein
MRQRLAPEYRKTLRDFARLAVELDETRDLLVEWKRASVSRQVRINELEKEKEVALRERDAAREAQVRTRATLAMITDERSSFERDVADFVYAVEKASGVRPLTAHQAIVGVAGIEVRRRTAIAERDALRAKLAEAEAALSACTKREPDVEKDDVPDAWTDEIREAVPTARSDDDLHAMALCMVDNRRSKAALVALVTWLLMQREAETERRLTAEHRERYVWVAWSEINAQLRLKP